MMSLRKFFSNRQNAQKSTGPRSEAGKKRARKDAMKHGLAIRNAIDAATVNNVERLASILSDVSANLSDAREIAEAAFEVDRVRRVRAALLSNIKLGQSRGRCVSQVVGSVANRTL